MNNTVLEALSTIMKMKGWSAVKELIIGIDTTVQLGHPKATPVAAAAVVPVSDTST
jgi:galactitol-specific phosphotransferase system IIC component